jgi:hypothetical protein
MAATQLLEAHCPAEVAQTCVPAAPEPPHQKPSLFNTQVPHEAGQSPTATTDTPLQALPAWNARPAPLEKGALE